MNQGPAEALPALNQADQEELTKLVNAVALSDRALTLFAIAPESGPDHPVVQQLKGQLAGLEEPLQFSSFFYSDNSLYNFLASLNTEPPVPDGGRRVVMAFGLEQLPLPRLKREMEQLNLGRERIFERNLVLVFWLNRKSFLDEFRSRAPDFWDWRGKSATFTTRPSLHPLLYPYLEWLITENSYLKISGVMQVNRQVDIFLDQVYVSLQAERHQFVTETTIRTQRQSVSDRRSSRSQISSPDAEFYGFDEPSYDEPLELEVEVDVGTTKTVTQKVNVSDAVKNSPYSVILGAPGAGKTTLLRYLALHFAKAKRNGQELVRIGEEQEDLGSVLLPVFFRIADYAERLEQQPELSLLDYLRQFYRRWEDSVEPEAADTTTEFPNLLLGQMQQIGELSDAARWAG